MEHSVSPVLQDYLPAFNNGSLEGCTPFLSYYDADQKPFVSFDMSREEVWKAAEGFGRLMVSSLGLKEGDCVVCLLSFHFSFLFLFSLLLANTLLDPLFHWESSGRFGSSSFFNYGWDNSSDHQLAGSFLFHQQRII